MSISDSQRLADNDIAASIGSKDDSYDNAMIDSLNGLYKSELIYPHGPWNGLNNVKSAPLQYVDCFNHQRRQGENAPPAVGSSPPPPPTKPITIKPSQPTKP